MKAVVSSNGQIVLPAEIRRRDRILSGQRFEIKRLAEGQYLLKRHAEPKKKGVVDWLLSCPEKVGLDPIESESTNTL